MNRLDAELAGELDALRAVGLFRELRRVASPAARRIELATGPLLNFSANDYLGLAEEPALKEAARRATVSFSSWVDLVCDTLPLARRAVPILPTHPPASAPITPMALNSR